ncbi:ATP-binding protein [Streptomyces longwoodensis]|uniref:ATP-binding protein n=1 Tax=Streptomyces longwoodensis TaxID=68231 RepID=UPI0036C27341
MPGYDDTEPRLRCVLPFRAAPADVPLLRRATTTQLADWGLFAAADEAELLVTELATNVVKHVGEGAPATLVLECRGERLRLEMHDTSSAMPMVRTPQCDEECGRGLHLLASMVVDWGAVTTAAGKAIWCEIPAAVAAVCAQADRAEAALERYQRREEDPELLGRAGRALQQESVIELIADLLHWTAARGDDPDDVIDRAQMRYESVLGEGAF